MSSNQVLPSHLALVPSDDSVSTSVVPMSPVAIEQRCLSIEAWAEGCESVSELRDAGARLAAIDEYLARTSSEGRAMVAATQRRLEVRIGILLGSATVGAHAGATARDLSRTERREFRLLATNPDAVEEVIANSTDDEPASRREALRAVAPHVARGSGDSEWYSPAIYVDAARRVMGGIDLDPASSAAANEVVRATTYYSAEDEGLAREWHGRVWMNPPYSHPLISQFCARLAESYTVNHIEAAVVLVNNATETAWFQDLSQVASAVCFPRGRIRFWAPTKVTATPLQGQAFLYFGLQPVRFVEEFSQFGRCWS